MKSCKAQPLVLEIAEPHYILGISLSMPIPDFLNERQALCGKLVSDTSSQPRIDLALQLSAVARIWGRTEGIVPEVAKTATDCRRYNFREPAKID